jgi:hypothetical protein
MKKKHPPPTLVKPIPFPADPHSGDPPRPLGDAGLALWRAVTSEYSIRDAGGIQTLCLACEALDRAEQIHRCIDMDGLMVDVGGTHRENPLLKHELANRAYVSRSLQNLGLDIGDNQVRPHAGRPSRGYPTV